MSRGVKVSKEGLVLHLGQLAHVRELGLPLFFLEERCDRSLCWCIPSHEGMVGG